MVDKECNLRAGVYKVQTFGTTQRAFEKFSSYKPGYRSKLVINLISNIKLFYNQHIVITFSNSIFEDRT